MSFYTEKTEISYDDYLKLEGLLVLGHAANEQTHQIARSIARLLGEDDPISGDRPGHAFDAIVEGYNARELLRKSQIAILPPAESAG